MLLYYGIYQDIELENTTIGATWMFKSFPQFNSSNNRTNCQAYREVCHVVLLSLVKRTSLSVLLCMQFSECARGCLVRAEPTAAQLNETQCRDECVSLFFRTNTNINVS